MGNVKETERRREYQIKYNNDHGIKPVSIIKQVSDVINLGVDKDEPAKKKSTKVKVLSNVPIAELERQMYEAAEKLDFETAAMLRDRIRLLQKSGV